MPNLTMDVFNQDAFQARNLTAALDRKGYVPTLLGSVPGLFVPPPLGQPMNKYAMTEERDDNPVLIRTSPRGAPPHAERTTEGTRKVRPITIPRIAASKRIKPDTLAGIRAFGTLTELMSLERKVGELQGLMQRDFALTWEHMRLSCIQGVTKDSDGTTLYNWATEFEQSIPAVVDFDLTAAAPASGILRQRCDVASRAIIRALKGLGGNNVDLWAFCGDGFWDAFVSHTEVRASYLNWFAAPFLREGTAFSGSPGSAYSAFPFGGINWVNYRSTDDTSTVTIPSNYAQIVPANAGIFQFYYAPADERFDFINTPGQEAYSWVVLDPQRQMFADVEMYSYPLPICMQPSAIYPIKRASGD